MSCDPQTPNTSPAVQEKPVICTNRPFAAAVVSVLRGTRARIIGQERTYPLLSICDAGVNETALCDIMSHEWWMPIKTSDGHDHPMAMTLSIVDDTVSAANVTVCAENNACKTMKINLETTGDCQVVARDLRSVLRLANTFATRLDDWIHLGDRCDSFTLCQGEIVCRILFPRTSASTGNTFRIMFCDDPLGIGSLTVLESMTRAQSAMEQHVMAVSAKVAKTPTPAPQSASAVSPGQSAEQDESDYKNNSAEHQLPPEVIAQIFDQTALNLEKYPLVELATTSRLGYEERLRRREQGISEDAPTPPENLAVIEQQLLNQQGTQPSS